MATLGEYASRVYTDGCPLQTLMLTLAGRPQDFDGKVIGPHASKEARLHWRDTAAMLVNCGGDKEQTRLNLVSLAESLGREDRIPSSHVCLVAAKFPIQPDEPGAALVLLGADHRQRAGRRAGMSSAASIFATLCFTAAFRAKEDVPVPRFLVPYLFYFASRLAEIGNLDVAAKYCDATFAAVQSISTSLQKQEKEEFGSSFLLQLEVSNKLSRQKKETSLRGKRGHLPHRRTLGASSCAPLLPWRLFVSRRTVASGD